MSLKENWKETGESLGKAFISLGKTLVRTVCTGVKKAEAWANEDAPKAQPAPSAPNPAEPAKKGSAQQDKVPQEEPTKQN